MTNAAKSLLVLVLAAALSLLFARTAWGLCAPTATGIFPVILSQTAR